MASKHLLFRAQAREKILHGATTLADAVRVTSGPRSRCVLIDKGWGKPLVCNDGVTIAKEVQLKDPEENLGARMIREVVTIPRRMSLRDAACLLAGARASGAPVVDVQGRCLGVLSAGDFLRWTKDGCPNGVDGPVSTCSNQVKGRLLSGEDALSCTLAEGSCPMQLMLPMAGGRHTAVCLLPGGVLGDRRQVDEGLSGGTACRYMTTAIVSAVPQTPLTELARMMVDAHVHRILVIDEQRRPVGVVSSTDVLAAVAQDRCSSGPTPLDPP